MERRILFFLAVNFIFCFFFNCLVCTDLMSRRTSLLTITLAFSLLVYVWLQLTPFPEDAPTKTDSWDPPAVATDTRPLLVGRANQCTRKPNRKPRGPFTGKEKWRSRQMVVESRKAIYCPMARVGSSRWKHLLLKADGAPVSLQSIGAPKVTK